MSCWEWKGKDIHWLKRIVFLPFLLLYFAWWILRGRTLAVKFEEEK